MAAGALTSAAVLADGLACGIHPTASGWLEYHRDNTALTAQLDTLSDIGIGYYGPRI